MGRVVTVQASRFALDLTPAQDRAGAARFASNWASARVHGTIVAEDLNVTGSRRPARHIADAGFAELRRRLSYKTAWSGGRPVTARRWYPSSKTCSGCGRVKTKPAPQERTYHCPACGLAADRDLNAARNLAAQHDTAGSGPAAGPDRKARPGGQAAVKHQTRHRTRGQDRDRPTARWELPAVRSSKRTER